MELQLVHDKTDSASTGWSLYLDGAFECFALGLPRDCEGQENVPDKTSIPYGRYPVEIVLSPHLGYECLHVKDVPGRDHILIHVANMPNELKGCFGVGVIRDTNCVIQSKPAYNALFEKVKEALKEGAVFVTVGQHEV